MIFRTEIQPLKGHTGKLQHGSPVLLLGSCFSDNIGERLSADLFDVVANPFGAIYNPLSVVRALSRLATSEPLTAADLFQKDGLWHSFQFHSRYSHHDQTHALEMMNRSLTLGRETLRKAGMVILTLGSTKAYLHEGLVVANCHKCPAREFEVNDLTLEECTQALTQAIELIRDTNPHCSVVLTVSPLRYLESGLHGNAVSKATLLLAAEYSCRRHSTIYFPAFEIMIDDLRDYRFYAPDMKHPSDVAVEYIYNLFLRSFCTESTVALAEQCRTLMRRLCHRPLTSSQDVIDREMEARLEAVRSFTEAHPEISGALKAYQHRHDIHYL